MNEGRVISSTFSQCQLIDCQVHLASQGRLSVCVSLFIDIGWKLDLVNFAAELTVNIPNCAYYPQLGIICTIGDMKSPIKDIKSSTGDNMSNLGLGIYESGKAESESQLHKISPIGDIKFLIRDIIIPNCKFKPFNGPGLAGAVLQTALTFIHWFIKLFFCSKSSKYLHSQTVRARELKCHIHLSHFSDKALELFGGGSLINGTYPV